MKKLSPGELVHKVKVFCREKREHHELIRSKEDEIKTKYENFDQQTRAEFFSILYDEFSENYDRHMGIETGHYAAMRRLLEFVRSEIRFPLLDITAGTGEAVSMFDGETVANEISSRMRKISEAKSSAIHTSHNAIDVPFISRFNTVLCSQTMHIVNDDDKAGIIRAIGRSLKSGGLAISIEEDPFRITETPSIEPISMFIRAVSCPVKPRKLIALFETAEFKHLELSAQVPIDEHHNMKIHLFRKA